MERGDIFAILTDGFYEWAREDGVQFGADRVSEIIKNRQSQSAEEILLSVRDNVEHFCETCQADDLTAIIIKRTG